jgi:hypothetical protein
MDLEEVVEGMNEIHVIDTKVDMDSLTTDWWRHFCTRETQRIIRE